jgi:hypothetical protein
MRIPNTLLASLAAALLLMLPGAAVHAQSSCAVGGFVTNKSKGALQQLLAFTTNSTFFLTYAGAITSGTSDCSSSGIVKEEYEQELFVAASYDSLLQDMAAGDGAYLRSFAGLMGCDAALYADFAHWGQANLERLASPPASPAAWVSGVRHDLAAHPSLFACARLG